MIAHVSAEPVFVDSNVFLYAADEADSAKQEAARLWLAQLWRSRRGRVSFQVLAEFYVNSLRIRPASREEARNEVRDLLAWKPVAADASLVEDAWAIQDRYHLSYWDAMIVASAGRTACRWLLTEDLKHGQRLDAVEIVNPFLSAPGQVL